MCGIAGIVGTSGVNQRIYDALTVLQHRGQDAAGIATVARRRAVRAQGPRPGARRVRAAPHAGAQGQHRHGPRALPDGRLRQRLRSPAVLRERAVRHLPRAQRQSHQCARARRSARARRPPPPQHQFRFRSAAQRARLGAAARRHAARHAGRHLRRGERGLSPLPRRLRRRRHGHRPRPAGPCAIRTASARWCSASARRRRAPSGCWPPRASRSTCSASSSCATWRRAKWSTSTRTAACTRRCAWPPRATRPASSSTCISRVPTR